MKISKVDNIFRLSSYGMRGIDEESDLFYYHLLTAMESPYLAQVISDSGLRLGRLLKGAYWLCWLASCDVLPEEENLVEELGSEEALHATAALAWVIARRLAVKPDAVNIKTLYIWMKRSSLFGYMVTFEEHCRNLHLNSRLPEIDIADPTEAPTEQLAKRRQATLQRAQQLDVLPTAKQPISIVAERVIFNNATITGDFVENKYLKTNEI